MALHIVIDGYNFIGSASGLRGNLERRRARLISELREYQDRQDYPIIVVFDGWRSGWIYEVDERVDGVTVIYSKKGEKADSVILRLARELGVGCVVVTSDRELRSAVEACGAVAIYVSEFRAKLHENKSDDRDQADRATGRSIAVRKKGNPRKLSKQDRKRRERLRKL